MSRLALIAVLSTSVLAAACKSKPEHADEPAEAVTRGSQAGGAGSAGAGSAGRV